MGSRRILIGLIALVSLSLPIWPDGVCGFTAVRDWAIGQLADWDPYTPSRDNPRIVAESTLSLSEDTVSVATGTSVSASYEPIPIDGDLVSGVSHELNRMAEGLDIAPIVAARAGSRPDSAGLSSDPIESKLAVDFCRSFEGPRAHALTENIVMVDDMFEENPETFEPSAEGLASNVEAGSIPAASPSCVEPIERLADFTESLSEEPNRLGEGGDIPSQDIVTPSARTRDLGLIEVPVDPGSETAYELNRASEGIGIVPPEVRRVGDVHPQLTRRQLGAHSDSNIQDDRTIEKAVRLTRDAAVAWLNLLRGPAAVKMTSR
jgi:hypothetical protein